MLFPDWRRGELIGVQGQHIDFRTWSFISPLRSPCGQRPQRRPSSLQKMILSTRSLPLCSCCSGKPSRSTLMMPMSALLVRPLAKRSAMRRNVSAFSQVSRRSTSDEPASRSRSIRESSPEPIDPRNQRTPGPTCFACARDRSATTLRSSSERQPWTDVAQALVKTAVGTEHIVSFFVTDRHRVVRSVGLPCLAELTGPIFVTPGLPRSVDLDAVVLHQLGDVVKWHGRELSSTKAAIAISQHAEKFKKWYLPAGQPFVKKAMRVWLKPGIGSTLQEVLSVLTAFQRAGLTATRVEFRLIESLYPKSPTGFSLSSALFGVDGRQTGSSPEYGIKRRRQKVLCCDNVYF